MAIVPEDIGLYLSGGAGNTQGATSLGEAISSTEVPTGLGALFDDASSVECQNGATEYRCIYVKNNHPTETLYSVVVWISQDTASPTTEINLGADPAGVNGTATTIVDPFTAPAGVTFTHPTDVASGIPLGDLPPGAFHAIWIQRIVDAGTAPLAADTAEISVTGVPA